MSKKPVVLHQGAQRVSGLSKIFRGTTIVLVRAAYSEIAILA